MRIFFVKLHVSLPDMSLNDDKVNSTSLYSKTLIIYPNRRNKDDNSNNYCSHPDFCNPTLITTLSLLDPELCRYSYRKIAISFHLFFHLPSIFQVLRPSGVHLSLPSFHSIPPPHFFHSLHKSMGTVTSWLFSRDTLFRDNLLFPWFLYHQIRI